MEQSFIQIYNELQEHPTLNLNSQVYIDSVREWNRQGGLVAMVLKKGFDYEQRQFTLNDILPVVCFNDTEQYYYIPVQKHVNITPFCINTLPPINQVWDAGFSEVRQDRINISLNLRSASTNKWYSFESACNKLGFGSEQVTFKRAY